MKDPFYGAACFVVPLIVFLVVLLVVMVIWKLTRSAVRSGVQQANSGTSRPLPPQAPPYQPARPAVPSEDYIRLIVRDEIQRVLAARAAAKARPGSNG
jgi:hypothetical protein